jgi:hypothetical protein
MRSSIARIAPIALSTASFERLASPESAIALSIMKEITALTIATLVTIATAPPISLNRMDAMVFSSTFLSFAVRNRYHMDLNKNTETAQFFRANRIAIGNSGRYL